MRQRKGRKLLLSKLASKAVNITPEATKEQQVPSSTVPAPSTPTVDADQSTNRDSPLLCDAQQIICQADKVVLSASMCETLGGVLCTTPAITYP